jgi:hypothetical protein
LDLPAFADYNDRRQLRAIAIIVEREGGKMRDCAFIYVHKTNGMIRVDSIDTARNVDGNPEWKHVATINPHVVLESILRATIKERNLIIKHLLT